MTSQASSFTLISVRQRGALKIPCRMNPSSLIFNQDSSGAAAALLLKTVETNKTTQHIQQPFSYL